MADTEKKAYQYLDFAGLQAYDTAIKGDTATKIAAAKTEIEAIINALPKEQFLDQAKTVVVDNFAWSEELYPGSTDPNLDGKPVLVLAVKNVDTETIAYSFLDFGKFLNTGKADKVANATDGNFAGLDDDGNLTDSGKKAADFDEAGAAETVKTEIEAVIGEVEEGETVVGLIGDVSDYVGTIPEGATATTIAEYIDEAAGDATEAIPIEDIQKLFTTEENK